MPCAPNNPQENSPLEAATTGAGAGEGYFNCAAICSPSKAASASGRLP